MTRSLSLTLVAIALSAPACKRPDPNDKDKPKPVEAGVVIHDMGAAKAVQSATTSTVKTTTTREAKHAPSTNDAWAAGVASAGAAPAQ